MRVYRLVRRQEKAAFATNAPPCATVARAIHMSDDGIPIVIPNPCMGPSETVILPLAMSRFLQSWCPYTTVKSQPNQTIALSLPSDLNRSHLPSGCCTTIGCVVHPKGPMPSETFPSRVLLRPCQKPLILHRNLSYQNITSLPMVNRDTTTVKITT